MSKSRTHLIMELALKNKLLRAKFSGTSPRKKKRTDTDPDYIPPFEESLNDLPSDDEPRRMNEDVESNVTSPRETDEITGKNDEAIIKNLLAKMINDIDQQTDKGLRKDGKPRKRRLFIEPLTQRKNQKKKSQVDSHQLKPPCGVCKLNCKNKITQVRREEVNRQFWRLENKERNMYAMKCIKKIPQSERTKNQQKLKDGRQRENAFRYFLENDAGEEVRICKKFLTSTLGFDANNDRLIKTVRQSIVKGIISPKSDGRGHHPNKSKIDRHEIKMHIKSYNPTISHYRREHAPSRLYLPGDVNIKMMYDNYIEKKAGCNVSYELYRKEVGKMNISFTKLGHEECFQCEEFNLHCQQENHSKDAIDLLCENCQKWKNHNEKYEIARAEYQKDAAKKETPDELIVSVDLQKVIMLPRADMFKEVIFIPRIIAFNESFVPVGTQKDAKPLAVVWYEAIAGRKKEDIISTFYAFFIKNRDIKRVTLWLDNCASQNKNWTLFCFFVYIVNCSEVSVEVVEIKYFETGHTFMSADSFHHQVELSLTKIGKVFDFNDYKNAVQRANSGKTDVFELKIDSFFHWQDFTSQQKLKKMHPRPYLNDFVSVLFKKSIKKNEHLMMFKKNHTEDYQVLNFLNAKAYKNGIPKPNAKSICRGIAAERKFTLVKKLKAIIPANRLTFWMSLPVSTNDEDDF